MRGQFRDASPHFLTDPAVPFSNNGVERALRMAKLEDTFSGGFLTVEGAARFALISGLIDTARKQGHNLLEGLQHTPQAPVPNPGTPSRKGYPNNYN